MGQTLRDSYNTCKKERLKNRLTYNEKKETV